jgi:dipeptidyl aminopeptidase/acylaminoacyl peptidase
LNLKLQFWTNRGFAVIDVNHRGSTGFGRKFRQSLYSNWGLFDLQDIEFAVRHLIDEGLVDPQKVAIRGGSAGGYSVMAALSKSNLFAAGASYYGISDLEVLTQGTHKFESRYLDQLIGPYPEARDIYMERSPIYNIDKITAPLLLLQGSEDKVVPPDQAAGICAKLKQKGVEVRYISFEGEGHGFRQLQNQMLALETELSFYREALKLGCSR